LKFNDATISCMRKIFLLALLLTLPYLTYAATSISGTWTAKLDYQGQGGTATFVLKQDGENLTGEYSGARGEADVTGTVKGRDVDFEFETTTALIHYRGKLSSDGSKIEGTYDYSGQTSGTFVATRAETN
jgi:hypothetical protein